MPIRRPPPPVPADDGVPPPVPSRPEAKKTGNTPANHPAPPDTTPPALPQRPNRNHQPEQEQDQLYEPIDAAPGPTIVPLGQKPLQGQRPAQPLPITTSHGVGKDPWQEDDQEDYVCPVPIMQGPKSSGNHGVGHHLDTIQQRQGNDPADDYELDGWPDSEWSEEEDTNVEEEEEDIYEDPGELSPETEDLYLQADPISPKALVPPGSKSNVPQIALNPADLKIGRFNLTNSTAAKPPTSKTNNTETPPTSFESAKKALEKKPVLPSKPTPPPKPKPGKPNQQTSATASTVTPSKSNNTHGASNSLITPDKETKRDSRSDDNSSSSSNSSGTGSHKKGNLPPIPKHGVKKDKPEDDKPANLSPHKHAMPLPPTLAKPPLSTPVDISEAQSIYVDAVSEPNLSIYDWFHGEIKRQECERRIATIGEIGTFLVRISSQPTKPNEENFPFALAVQTKSDVKTLRIRQRLDNNFAVGSSQKADELSFPTLEKLVEYHRNNNVRIFQNGKEDVVKLCLSPKKS